MAQGPTRSRLGVSRPARAGGGFFDSRRRECYEQAGHRASIRHVPELDPKYFPILRFNQAFLKTAKKPVTIAVERDRGQVAVCRTFIHGTDERYEADCYYMDRLVKTLL